MLMVSTATAVPIIEQNEEKMSFPQKDFLKRLKEIFSCGIISGNGTSFLELLLGSVGIIATLIAIFKPRAGVGFLVSGMALSIILACLLEMLKGTKNHSDAEE
ncbi:MAG TPA: hypothetical protein ENG60_03695 [Thermoplasmatales archaeon]|nr:hypothetical protein [Thermoplasmatales archaeon]HEX17492.1 hypothetical protein [Thermoplasmatales archaeon]